MASLRSQTPSCLHSFSKEIRDSVATDCVDEDELYPYSSFERVRKDISGGIVMTEGRQKKQVTDGVERTDTELVVTVRRTGFLKRHRPEFPVPPRWNWRLGKSHDQGHARGPLCQSVTKLD
ncbi:hypothetical protein PI125_g6557 [Phytophthora idaei]|nr:hypothetical protein PI125_g6557 [Phytophthora idaei]